MRRIIFKNFRKLNLLRSADSLVSLLEAQEIVLTIFKLPSSKIFNLLAFVARKRSANLALRSYWKSGTTGFKALLSGMIYEN